MCLPYKQRYWNKAYAFITSYYAPDKLTCHTKEKERNSDDKPGEDVHRENSLGARAFGARVYSHLSFNKAKRTTIVFNNVFLRLKHQSYFLFG